ncbi:hypothetical protein BGX27_007177, partial [Mortierella sp. AM989]
RSRGFGFVTFADDAGAEQAIHNLHEQEFEGRTIKVDRASERAPGGNGGRGGYGGFRGGYAPRHNDGGGRGGYGGQTGRSDVGDWGR